VFLSADAGTVANEIRPRASANAAAKARYVGRSRGPIVAVEVGIAILAVVLRIDGTVVVARIINATVARGDWMIGAVALTVAAVLGAVDVVVGAAGEVRRKVGGCCLAVARVAAEAFVGARIPATGSAYVVEDAVGGAGILRPAHTVGASSVLAREFDRGPAGCPIGLGGPVFCGNVGIAELAQVAWVVAPRNHALGADVTSGGDGVTAHATCLAVASRAGGVDG